jgi:ABC-type transporter Mla subunit MlaD
VATSLLGRSTLLLVVHDTTLRGTLEPEDTIGMQRRPAAVEAFGDLAVDLKGTIQDALEATTGTLHSVQHLADSLALATGTARRFMAGIQPGTEKTLAEVAANLERVRRLLDTADVRSGLTLRQLDATLEQSRRLMASADSLSRLVTSLGGENRPELHAILVNSRLLMEQLLYVTEQLSRRPMRAMTGVQLPDSLTAAGRARRAAADSLPHRTDPPPRDTGRSPQLP